jgi:hypothetical protein
MNEVALDCVKDLDWNPLITAQQHSQFAGVVAGLVFTVIAVLVVTPKDVKLEATLQLFVATLFAFAYDSYGYGVISGEQVCARGYVESVMCGAVLGIGSTGLLTGLAWLVHSYGYTGPALRLVRLVSGAVSLIVALMIIVSAQGYAQAVLYPTAWRGPLETSLYALTAASALIVVWAYRKPANNRAYAVRWASRTSAAFVLISAIVAGIAASFPAHYWNTSASWVVLGVVGLSVTLPAASVVLHVRSLPD